MKLPSPALVVSALALVAASSGASYAAVKIGSADIRDNSVRSIDVRNGTLRNADFADGTLQRGPRGARGPAGAQGEAGRQGPAGAGRWVLVAADGTIEAQSGGFEMTAAYPTLAPTGTDPGGLRANGNVYIDANEDLTDNAVVAVVALQNTTDQNADGITNGRAAGADANPEFAGEISAGQCQITGLVACGPPAAQTTSHFVVSPRNSDGTATTDGARKRFYVVISGDSSDYVAP